MMAASARSQQTLPYKDKFMNSNLPSSPCFQILRARHLGMCFGVRDAIALAMEEAKQRPLTILGELVHNETVLNELERHGIRLAAGLEQVETSAAMITAHGASDKALAQARGRGLHLVEATCPLVHVAHRAVKKLVAEGYYPVVIGKRGHVEVRGLTEDFAEVSIVLAEDEIRRLPVRDRYGVVAQTTQPIDRVQQLVAALREYFSKAEVRFIDTVCQPTKQRQEAAIDVALRCDVVVVVGGLHSNNTRELVETCRRFCAQVHYIQTAGQLDPKWFESAATVGLTAGTSTPDGAIDEVEERLQQISEALGLRVNDEVPVAAEARS
jgi:4-hydroxy-3-methylbut-2-enyl diphosphate reductase